MRRIYSSLLIMLLVTAFVAVTGSSDAIAKKRKNEVKEQATIEAPITASAERPYSFADLAERLLPAVVNISSTQKAIEPEDFPDMPHFPQGSPFEDFFEDFMGKRGQGMPSLPAASLGSGFVIDAENGYIVTNNHVIEDAEEVRVTFHDDTTIDAEIIGRDEKTDLAILKIDTEMTLTEVSFGDSDVIRVGDWIVAIGNPFGLGGTVTAGIISAQQRNINSGPYDDFIQTDASINRGNSGGPMFDVEGNVIGVNTAIFSPSGGSVGIGFAVPSNLAKPVIKQLIKFGHTRRGWLGVRIQKVTDDIADSLGLDKAKGALIASTTDTGPAEKAGLEPGDVILEFNGKPVKTMRGLPRIVAETAIDEKVKVKYWREGKEKTTSVTIGELEKAEETGLISSSSSSEDSKDGDEDKGTSIDSLGLTLSKLTREERKVYNIDDDVEGVIIIKVEEGSAAFQKGIIAGDVIVEINQQSVSKPKNAADIVKKAKKAGRNSVLLLINRDGDSHFDALGFKKD